MPAERVRSLLGRTENQCSTCGSPGLQQWESRKRRRGWALINPWMAGHLARALDVPENRVRRAAGLPEVPDPRADVPTGPHLRLVTNDVAGGA